MSSRPRRKKKRRPAPRPFDGNIVLVGFMGCGKSSVGRLLAANLGFRFVDTDQLIARNAGMEIPEIFAARGEEGFREEEKTALRSAADARRTVIATGGGIVTRPENIGILRQLGFVVWLRASEETIYERVSRNTRRPLLQTENPRETIALLLAERRPLYEQAAHETIDTSRQPHAQIAAAIRSAAARFYSPRPPTPPPAPGDPGEPSPAIPPDETGADREEPIARV